MQAREIRQKYLQFFEQRGHSVVPSSSLVPEEDPSLLFVNSGMVPFKDVFTGASARDYTRATSCQRSIRAGGKHNDLEQVGYTKRHHTLFEMLGNFSFGDYFKDDAIAFAWEFVTKVLSLPLDRLYVSIYKDDEEAYKIWRSLNVSTDRIYRFGEKDNFWSMGDTGPCGPCSEIFYDLGPEAGTGPEDVMGGEGDRFLEFWNLVFMQYETRKDGTRHVLPRPSIDTGMGLERVTTILQGKVSNYDTDIFTPLTSATASRIGSSNFNEEQRKIACQVIADHARAATMLVGDGVLPSNLGRGYVLRRIMRRAIRFSYQLGIQEPFLFDLSKEVMNSLGEAHPIFSGREAFVTDTIRREEDSFLKTVHKGLDLLEQEASKVTTGNQVPAETVFLLYDTFGFPKDLTRVVLKERNMDFDEKRFDDLMEEQRERARAAQKFSSGQSWETTVYLEGVEGEFVGYDSLQAESSIARVSINETKDVYRIVLTKTPFYAESGGQVGDRGVLKAGGALFRVFDCQKEEGSIVHYCELEEGALDPKVSVLAEVDANHRHWVVRNHTAVHMLQAALKEELGEHIQQAGSYVDAERFRFDFSHPQALSAQEIESIEQKLFFKLNEGREVVVHNKPLEEARQMGAICPFGEKYGDLVRIIDVPGWSMEFCGGTHVSNVSEIGMIKIVSESSIASGVRRIEGVTSRRAFELFQKDYQAVESLKRTLKTKDDVIQRIDSLMEDSRQKDKEILKLKTELSRLEMDKALEAIEEIGQTRVLAASFSGMDAKVFRTMSDTAMQKVGSGIVVLGNDSDGKASLLCRISDDLVKKGMKANDILNPLAEMIGGRGGGKPNMAQAGGTQPEKLPQAMARVSELVRGLVS